MIEQQVRKEYRPVWQRFVSWLPTFPFTWREGKKLKEAILETHITIDQMQQCCGTSPLLPWEPETFPRYLQRIKARLESSQGGQPTVPFFGGLPFVGQDLAKPF